MEKIPTMFVRDESKPGHPVTNQIKPECQWVLDGEGVATRKYDGTNVKVLHGALYKRQKPKEKDYDNASYVQCDPSNPSDQYLFEAFNGATFEDGIYEAVGPKIQGNPEKWEVHALIKVVPAPDAIVLEDVPRTFDGLKEYLSGNDIEGIVFHNTDGRFAKIKKRDFGFKREIAGG